MPATSSRYLIDNNLFIAATKRGWTRSTDLLTYLLDGPFELIGDEVLYFEYDKWAKIIGVYGGFLLTDKFPINKIVFAKNYTFLALKTSVIHELPSFSIIFRQLQLGLDDFGIFQCAELIQVKSKSSNHHLNVNPLNSCNQHSTRIEYSFNNCMRSFAWCSQLAD